MNKRIAFFGNERLATGVSTELPVIHTLLDEGYDIAAIVSSSKPSTSRNKRTLEIESFANKHNIKLINVAGKKLDEVANSISELKADTAVLVAFGKIVPQSIIDIFPNGIINIHPSLLPLHRGPTPIESVILQGATETGMSIMQLAAEMDAGPVYVQQTVPLSQSETKQKLAQGLGKLGATLLKQILPDIISGKASPKEQDHSIATYDKLIRKEDGKIDLNKSATQIEREVRAYADWPKSTTTLADKDVVLTSVDVSDNSGEKGAMQIIDGQIYLYCAEGSLVIKRLKPLGKQEMSAQSFVDGYVKP